MKSLDVCLPSCMRPPMGREDSLIDMGRENVYDIICNRARIITCVSCFDHASLKDANCNRDVVKRFASLSKVTACGLGREWGSFLARGYSLRDG
jgi:hypothetical protein